MLVAKIAIIVYGILAIAGGIIGYQSAKSKVSLISGTISGVLLLIGGIASFFEQNWGIILGAIVAAVLVVVFIVRLVKTKKFMPAGLMILGGVMVLLVTLPPLLS